MVLLLSKNVALPPGPGLVVSFMLPHEGGFGYSLPAGSYRLVFGLGLYGYYSFSAYFTYKNSPQSSSSFNLSGGVNQVEYPYDFYHYGGDIILTQQANYPIYNLRIERL